MTEDDPITIERRQRTRPRVEKFTVALDPEAAALLRVAAADWNLSQAQTIALALRCFHASGAATAMRVRIDAEGQARIAAAVERASTIGERLVLDERVHGRRDGERAG